MSFESGGNGSTERTTAGAGAPVPPTPPPEVAQAISVASHAYEELTATGQQLHFEVDDPDGTVAVEVQDLAGNQLSTISASEALRIAGGEPLN
jgi:hypothetical protein